MNVKCQTLCVQILHFSEKREHILNFIEKARTIIEMKPFSKLQLSVIMKWKIDFQVYILLRILYKSSKSICQNEFQTFLDLVFAKNFYRSSNSNVTLKKSFS